MMDDAVKAVASYICDMLATDFKKPPGYCVSDAQIKITMAPLQVCVFYKPSGLCISWYNVVSSTYIIVDPVDPSMFDNILKIYVEYRGSCYCYERLEAKKFSH